mgnify:CR=1 FL=1
METLSQQLTPTDILNILIEQHRISSKLDFEADPEAILTFDSTINYWRNAGDLLPWKPLSEFLNECFGISITETKWEQTLTPSRKRTLRDVCKLIAENCEYQDIKPITILGKECLSASVFLTLKKYLKRRNVDVSNIKPSSLIAPYLEKYYSEMLEQIGIISKGSKIFEEFDYKPTRKLKPLERLNIFDKSRYSFQTGEILTFRDLTMKIIETK